MNINVVTDVAKSLLQMRGGTHQKKCRQNDIKSLKDFDLIPKKNSCQTQLL